MNIERKYKDPDEKWIKTNIENCLYYTEQAGYWKTGTVLDMLMNGQIVFTPFAIYRKKCKKK